MDIPDFLIRAGLAGLGAAAAAGPIGCFVVWRRMAFFGDATAHAALLGVAGALAFSAPVYAGVFAAALAMAVGASALSGVTRSTDATLAVLAHSALAFGLLAAAAIPEARIGLEAWLFGDVLAVRPVDLVAIWGGALGATALLVWRWSALLAATLDPDLARSGGIDPRRERLALTLALAALVAVAIKIVGALLIAALLVLPAAAARPLARSPEAMAIGAAALGAAAALGGLALSWRLDAPTGPSIVAAAAGLFAATHLLAALRR